MIEYEDAYDVKIAYRFNWRRGYSLGTDWDCDVAYPICDEDLDRANETKTSAVHFLRYELTEEMITGQSRLEIFWSITSKSVHTKTKLPTEIQQALTEDLVLL